MLTILLALAVAAAPAEIIDRIMAVVGAQPITLSEVTAARELQLVEVPPGTADAQGYVLDRLIDRTLMLTEVNRFQPPEPDASEIARRLDQMQARAGSAAAFDQQLAVTGASRDLVGRFIRDSLRIATYSNQRFGTAGDATERAAAVASWTADLRRRAHITVLYRPPQPPGSSR